MDVKLLGSNLVSPYSINDPRHWLNRAKETRALAEQIADPEAKRTMLKNADDYERLAQRAEHVVAPPILGGAPSPICTNLVFESDTRFLL
jgi:hypothetical protein